MRKVLREWAGPTALVLAVTLLALGAGLVPNSPVWADIGDTGLDTRDCLVSTTGLCDSGCRQHELTNCGDTHAGCKDSHRRADDCALCKCRRTQVELTPGRTTEICWCVR
jgi:hypothetical protein